MAKGLLGYACKQCFGVFKSLEEVRWKKTAGNEQKEYICEDCLNTLLNEHRIDGDVSCDVYVPSKTGSSKAVTSKNITGLL